MLLPQTITWLRATLWALLANTEEELSVATSSTLSLLAALYSPAAAVVADADLAAHLPILWPFLSHTLTSVRLAAATCLASVAGARDTGARAAAAAAAVTAAGGDAAAAAAAAAAAIAATGAPAGQHQDGSAAEEPGAWLQPVVGPCLRMLLQCLVMEKAEAVQQVLLQAWRSLLQHSRPADVAAGLSARDMRAMLNLLCTACGHALDVAALVVPLQRRLVPWSSPEAEVAGLASRPAKRPRSEPAAAAAAQGMNGLGGAGAGGAGAGVAGCAVDPEAWPGMSDPQAAAQTRLLASRAVAELCDKLTGQVSRWVALCRRLVVTCSCMAVLSVTMSVLILDNGRCRLQYIQDTGAAIRLPAATD